MDADNRPPEGQGVFDSKPTGKMPIESGTLIFLFPGVWHRYRPDPTTGWTERWLSFNGEITHRLMNLDLIHPEKALRPSTDLPRLVNCFDKLLERIHHKPMTNSILLSLHAMDLVAEAIEQTLDTPQTSAAQCAGLMEDVTDSLVMQTLDLIWTHSHRPLSVSQLAKRLPVSRRTLERRFAQERGHSILNEINACRLSRAKRFLGETDLSIKTVAYLAGFTGQEYMRVTFQNLLNCAPDHYRKKKNSGLLPIERWT